MVKERKVTAPDLTASSSSVAAAAIWLAARSMSAAARCVSAAAASWASNSAGSGSEISAATDGSSGLPPRPPSGVSATKHQGSEEGSVLGLISTAACQVSAEPGARVCCRAVTSALCST